MDIILFLIWTVSIILSFVFFISLLCNKAYKSDTKKTKLHLLISILTVIISFPLFISEISEPKTDLTDNKETESVNKLENHEYCFIDDCSLDGLTNNEIISSKLKEIGVEQIKNESSYNTKTESETEQIITVPVKYKEDTYELDVNIFETDNSWSVKYIKKGSDYVYVDDAFRYDTDGNELYNIYDFRNNDKIAIKYIKPMTDEEKAALEQQLLEIAQAKDAREQEEIEKSKTILDEIGIAYDNNSITAKENYWDQTYLITATVESVDTTLIGKPRVTVYQNTHSARCVFNEGMMDKVKEVNKGDVITFYGTLDGWGIQADFTHCYFKK